MANLRDMIADELKRTDECGGISGLVSDDEYLADADALVNVVRTWQAEQRGWAVTDRPTLDELVNGIHDLRAKARWLGVRRRMHMAKHVEEILDVAYRLALDLRGRHQRKEPL